MVGLAAALALVVAAGADGDGRSAGERSAPPGTGGPACASSGPCTFVNGFASSTANGDAPKLMSFADAAALAKPASACPGVARDYASVGIEVAGVIGPCPGAVDANQARVAAASAAAAGLGLGGTR